MSYDLSLLAPKNKKEPADIARWQQELSEDETIGTLCEITYSTFEEDHGDQSFASIGMPQNKKDVQTAYSAIVNFAAQRHLKVMDQQLGDYIPLDNPGLFPPMMFSMPKPVRKADPSHSLLAPWKVFLGGLTFVAVGILMRMSAESVLPCILFIAFGAVGCVASVIESVRRKREKAKQSQPTNSFEHSR